MVLMNIKRELLEQLAPEDPINQDEMGGCVWCGCGPPRQSYGYAGRQKNHHADDCPWVAARELLGDEIPENSKRKR